MNFDFDTDYILENEYVVMRPLQISDFDHLVNYAINEPELWKFSLVQATNAELMKNYIQLALSDRNNKKSYPFIVFDKINQQYAGSTRFYDIQLENSSMQLGFTWYGKKFHGTGLNKHCKYLLLDFAFDQMSIERIEFRADNDNLRSITAMKSIGCTVEGILRSNTYKSDGSRRDSIVLSILKHEWFDHIKNDLNEKCKPVLKFTE